MNIQASALSLNVPDVDASVRFAVTHLGFATEMTADGMASLRREGVGFNLVFLRTGLPSFRPPACAGSAKAGILVVFVVEDCDREHERLVAQAVPVVTPLQTEPWGQRFFQVQDPNGIVYEITHWEGGAPA